MKRAAWLASIAAVVAACGRYRAWHLTWGASDLEVAAKMPGDDLLGAAAFTATRAITVEAPPEDVWPWLVQVGFHRAGFYSYDWLDNLGRESARVILQDYQEPRLGDLAAPMADPANERTAFRVAFVEPPTVLVWAKPDSTWAWELQAQCGGRRTRLITRLKARYEFGPMLPLTVLLMEVADFPMMRRMLLGLSERAESSAGAKGADLGPPGPAR